MDARLFVSKAAHAREIDLADGSKTTVHFRVPTNDEHARYSGMVNAGLKLEDPAEKGAAVNSAAKFLIGKCLVDEEGVQVLTPELADQLHPDVVRSMTNAIIDISKFTEKN